MLGVVLGGGLDGIGTEGDLAVIGRLLAVIESPDRSFPIVTP
jgi:alkyl sulfatase BDS1-like metallo-beta-lactamase superfamily hydrolase